MIKKYIQDQEKADIMWNKLSVKEYEGSTNASVEGSYESIAMWLERDCGKNAKQNSHSMKEKASVLKCGQVVQA